MGFSDEIKRRIKEHKNGQVSTTKDFGKFRCFKLEEVISLKEAREREKYWKSSAGRKKLKKIFRQLKN